MLFGPSRDSLLATCSNSTPGIQFYDFRNLGCVSTPLNPTVETSCLLRYDDWTIISASRETISLLDIETRTVSGTLQGPSVSTMCLCAHVDGRNRLLSGSGDSLRLWSLDDFQESWAIAQSHGTYYQRRNDDYGYGHGHTSQTLNHRITDVGFVDAKQMILSGGSDGTVRARDIVRGDEIKSLEVRQSTVAVGTDSLQIACQVGKKFFFVAGRNSKVIDQFDSTTMITSRSYHFSLSGNVDVSRLRWFGHTLFCGTADGHVLSWDDRYSSVLLCRQKVHGDAVTSFIHLQDAMWASCSADKTLSTWNEQIQVKNSVVSPLPIVDLCFMGKLDPAISVMGEESDTAQMLMDLECLDLELSGNYGEDGVKTSRALLGNSRFVREDSLPAVLPQGTQLESEGLLQTLLGRHPASESLYDFYCLFRELHLEKLACATCLEISRIHAIAQLLKLAILSFQRRENEDDEQTEFTLFEEEILRQLKFRQGNLKKKDFHSLGFICKYLMVGEDPLWNRTPRNHPEMSRLDSNPSFEGIFADRAKELYLSREFANVTLQSSDGGEEKAHVEILVSRSKFFSGMLHFKGSENEDFRTHRRLRMEDMSHVALCGLLSYLYTGSFGLKVASSLNTLLRLSSLALMHVEEDQVTLLKREINALVDSYKSADLVHWLLHSGWVLSDFREA